MFTVNIKFDDSKAQELLARAPAVFQAAAESATDWALQTLERAVKQNIASGDRRLGPAGDNGTLLNAVYSEPKPRPEIGGIVDLHPPADVYAAPVEYGARPHMPPVEALFGWVRRKLRIEDEKEIKRVAWAIAITIAKRGTAGIHMFQYAVEAWEAPIIAKFNEEIAAAVEKLNAGEQ